MVLSILRLAFATNIHTVISFQVFQVNTNN